MREFLSFSLHADRFASCFGFELRGKRSDPSDNFSRQHTARASSLGENSGHYAAPAATALGKAHPFGAPHGCVAILT